MRTLAAQLSAASPAASLQPVMAGASARPVLQAKLFRGRSEITALPQDASSIVRTLDEDATGYVLRSSSALTDPSVQALRRDSKYLLGERHDESKWAELTAGWDVDTMIEAGKAIPEEQPVYAGQGTRADQPLESSHAYAVASILQWRFWFTSWLAPWQEWKDARNQQIVEIDDAELESDLANLETSASSHGGAASDQQVVKNQHTENPVIGDSKEEEELAEGNENPSEDSFYNTDNTRVRNEVSYAELIKWCGQLKAMINLQTNFLQTGSNVPDSPPYILMKRHLVNTSELFNQLTIQLRFIQESADDQDQERERRIGEIGPLANKIIGNIAIMFGSALGKDMERAGYADLVSIAKGQRPLQGGEELSLSNPVRETAMARNVTAARAPLLVKIGNEHVERVAAQVEGGVPVPISENFDEMTLFR